MTRAQGVLVLQEQAVGVKSLSKAGDGIQTDFICLLFRGRFVAIFSCHNCLLRLVE